MSPALIALIAQYVLQYGLPAALKIIQTLMAKGPVTEAEWAAAFATAQTPYGLTAQVSTVQDLGVVISPIPTTQTSGIAEFDSPPANFLIVKLTTQGQSVTICNQHGNCWFIPDIREVGIATYPEGQIWIVPGGLRFFILKSAISA